MNKYRILAIVLILIGLALVSSYLLMPLIPLIAFGLSAIIMGLSCICLAGTESLLPAQNNGKTRAISTEAGFIISLGVAFALNDILTAATNQPEVAVYFIGLSLAFIVITLLHVNLIAWTRMKLDILGSFIFIAFLVMIVFKISQITT